MSLQFSRTFKTVAIVHAVLLVLIFSQSGIARLLEPKQEMVIPVEFVVDVSPSMPNIADLLPPIPDIPEPDPVPEPEPVPQSIPEPAAVPEPQKVPEPPPKRKRPEIKISHKRVTRTTGKHKNPLSKAEIQKLLDMGAKAGDYTSVPDEDARCLSVIKNTLHTVWDQPAAEDVGDAVAVLQIKLSAGGNVSGGRLHRKSGNAALDSSVLRIAGNIRRIHGLTPDFIRRHPSVTISFSVD